MLTFLIMVGFNILWLYMCKHNFKRLYNGADSVWLSALFWIYAAWGVGNLIHHFLK